MLTPNKEALTLWVEALESGKYRQTRGRYTTPRGRRLCALGLRNLLYLTQRRHLDEHRLPVPETLAPHDKLGWLSIEADQWYGVPAFTPFIETLGHPPATVPEANDYLKMSFFEIAQHIRKKYL